MNNVLYSIDKIKKLKHKNNDDSIPENEISSEVIF